MMHDIMMIVIGNLCFRTSTRKPQYNVSKIFILGNAFKNLHFGTGLRVDDSLKRRKNLRFQKSLLGPKVR